MRPYILNYVKSKSGKKPKLQEKDVTITENGTTKIEADTGFDGLKDVDVTVSGILDTSDATAVANNIEQDKTAYVNGQKITGNIFTTNRLYQEGRLTTSLSADNYLHLIASWSIKLILNQNSPVELATRGDAVAEAIGLTPEKLKKDETILGVTGTLEAGTDTSDATAVASDILNGKTAYVNGEKLTGNIPVYANNQTRYLTSSFTNLYENSTSFSFLHTMTGGDIAYYKEYSKIEITIPFSKISITNLSPENIKSGVTILGVTGTYTGE